MDRSTCMHTGRQAEKLDGERSRHLVLLGRVPTNRSLVMANRQEKTIFKQAHSPHAYVQLASVPTHHHPLP